MLTESALLERFRDRKAGLFDFIEQQSRRRYFQILCATTLALVTILLSFPDYDLARLQQPFYDAVDQQYQHPFDHRSYTLDRSSALSSHFSNRYARVTVPLVARTLHLNSRAVFILLHFLTVVFFLVILRLFLAITGDAVSSTLLTAAFAFLYPGQSFFFYMPTYDCVGYLLVAGAMLTCRPLLIWLFVIAAAFNDERALVATSAVAAYHLIAASSPEATFLRRIWQARHRLAAVLAAWALYLALRTALTRAEGVELLSHSWGIRVVLVRNYTLMPLVTLLSMEGLWSLMFVASAAALVSKRVTDVAVCWISVGFILLTAFGVDDVSRSAAYAFAVAIPATRIVAANVTVPRLRDLSLFALLASIAIPTYFVWGSREISWPSPVVPKIAKFFVSGRPGR